MEQLGLNQRSLALKAGLHEDAVRNLFRGKSKSLRSDTYEKIMDVLGVAETARSEVLTPDAGAAYIPAYDVSASAGNGQIITQENVIYHLTFRREWLRRVTNAPLEKLGVIAVEGDSMQPTLSPEDTVLIDMTQLTPKKDGIYVLRYNESVLVKRIQIDPVRRTATILSDNPAYPPINHIMPEEISVIGRVLWIGRRV
ncbi:MAG: S24 family peptidase [Alphaproteobacteria bacterium]|nr:S24 family peptidase [Alphaproteobacteria bacterium]